MMDSTTDPERPLLYGNESPVEEYVNNTGLMWTMGYELGAMLVFAEHRYFGQSMPQLLGVEDCLAYCTSSQALADYAMLVEDLRYKICKYGPETLEPEDVKFIAFGGSYGGMLSSWARYKYPASFAGAIAGSAPILGFPLLSPALDGSARVVTHAASAGRGATNADNILASSLINELGKYSRAQLAELESLRATPRSGRC